MESVNTDSGVCELRSECVPLTDSESHRGSRKAFDWMVEFGTYKTSVECGGMRPGKPL